MYGHVMSGGAFTSIHLARTWSAGAKVEHIAVHDLIGVLGAMVFLRCVDLAGRFDSTGREHR